MIPALEKHCIDFLMQSLSTRNVFEVLESGLLWNLGADLLEKCKEVIRTRTNEVLNSEPFSSISRDLMSMMAFDGAEITKPLPFSETPRGLISVFF